MTGSIAGILTGGFGNGTFAGSPSLVVTMGYGIGAAVVPPSRHPRTRTPTLIAVRTGTTLVAVRTGTTLVAVPTTSTTKIAN